MFTLQRKSSIDGKWETYSKHDTREQAREAGQRFKDGFANALQLVDPSGNVVDQWKEG